MSLCSRSMLASGWTQTRQFRLEEAGSILRTGIQCVHSRVFSPTLKSVFHRKQLRSVWTSAENRQGEEQKLPREEGKERNLHNLGSALVQAVGLRHYEGKAGPGDNVVLVREFQNLYDRNAIRIDNSGGIPVGYVARYQARGLAVLMDQKLAQFTVEIPSESIGKWDLPYEMPCVIRIAIQASQAPKIVDFLRRCNIKLEETDAGCGA